MPTQKKIENVQNLTEKIGRAKALVIADYRGLKHKQLEEVRKLIKKTEADFIVAKNRLLLKALGDKAPVLKEALHDTTAVLFAYGDQAAPLKELVKFFKAAGFGKLKAGLLGAQVLTEAEVVRLAALPTREVLLNQLVRELNAPIQGLHYALQWNFRKFAYAMKAIEKGKSST